MLGNMALYTSGGILVDPASLALTAWYQPSWPTSWSGGTHSGTASAGSSGSRAASLATGAFTTNDTLNSYNLLDFTGSQAFILETTSLEVLINQTAGSVWVLFKPDVAPAPGASVANDPSIFTDFQGFCIISYNSGGVSCSLWDTAYRTNTHTAATGSWHLVQMKWDGTNLYSRVNSGSWSQVACTGPSTRTNSVRAGYNYLATAFYDGRYAEVGVIDQVLTDLQFDGIKAYINSRYALAL